MVATRKIKGFTAYLLIVFLNAFVDLGHKIIIQNTLFKSYDGDLQIILTSIINGFILLPFILLFTPSGFISDRFPKHLVMRYGAVAAVIVTCLITMSYYMGWFWVAFGLTLLLAMQSAVYSPAKYGYIRELVGDENITRANALVQSITIVAILSGTFVFSFLFEGLIKDTLVPSDIVSDIAVLGWVLVGLSCIELVLAFDLPEKYGGNKALSFDIKQYVGGQRLRENLVVLCSTKSIWLSILGLSMFWAISQALLASFPAYAKATFGETNTVVIQGILACTGFGIVLGSWLADKVSKSYIELGLIPLGSMGIALGLLFLTMANSYILLAGVFLFLGFTGGIFIVPLNSLIQYSAKEEQLGLILSGNNWVQNIVMLSFLVITAFLAVVGIHGVGFFYILSAVALLGSIYTIKQLPQSMARLTAKGLIRHKYRIQVEGFENLPKQGGVLLLGNHVSWIDWLIVQIACPRSVRFVILRSIYERWYLKPIFRFFGAIPISPRNSRDSLSLVNQCLKNGEVVCLFPEGAISRNGQLGPFKRGYERAVVGLCDTDAVILPFYLRGLWGSRLSRSGSEKLRLNTSRGIKRNLVVAFGPPLSLNTTTETLKQRVFELSIDAWQQQSEEMKPIPRAWLTAAKANLQGVAIVDDRTGTMNNASMLVATTALSALIRRRSPEQNIGLLLPASAEALMGNMAVMLNAQTCVNLNYNGSIEAVQAAIHKAEIKTVYSSKSFIHQLQQHGVNIDAMLEGVCLVYMEDVKTQVSKIRLVLGWFAAYCLPASWIYRLMGRCTSIDTPAQILFSSDSDGNPQGIILSHKNIMANILQISDVLNTQSDDVFISCLPPCHSFGLTVTSLLPLIQGLPAICQPDPKDVVRIAKAIARNEVTIMCGTSSLLGLYSCNDKVDPLMFESLRVVVSGAERLSPDVRESFELKFKKTIYEGYGTTETTPVATVNVPNKLDLGNFIPQVGHKPGTVGLPLPGSCVRIVDSDSMDELNVGEDGLILISGGQVMQGYLKDRKKTADVIVEIDGRRWYKTGDIGHVDLDGFLTIADCYACFTTSAEQPQMETHIE